MTALYTIRDALSAFFSSPLRKWSSVFLLAVLALGGAYYYQLQSLGKVNAAYTIANSARFISGNSDNLTKTLTTPTSQNIYTFSTWVKRGKLGVLQNIFGVSTNYSLGFPAADTLAVTIAGTAQATTAGVWRDPAVWMHVVYVQNGTAITVYVNGVSAATGTGTNSAFNTAAAHQIGSANSSNYFDGYMADFYYVDGAALAPTCFGTTDANGYWRPITYSTASPCAAYGTNGFKLDFSNSADFGNDVSGGTNDWTNNNLATTDQVTDSPTNSFATLSPIDKESAGTLSTGNLKIVGTASAGNVRGTIAIPSTGKWYFEAAVTSDSGATSNPSVGIDRVASTIASANTNAWRLIGPGSSGTSYDIYNNGSDTGANITVAAGDFVGVAIDMDSGYGWIRNSTGWEQGDPVAGTSPRWTGIPSDATVMARTNGSAVANFNFGQGGQSGLTYDSASGGTFKYTPPSGFKALSTNNLPEPTIAVPKNYFDAVTYTGTGAAKTVKTSIISFTTTGTTTWQAPTGVTSVDYLVVGGGGGGGPGDGGGGSAGQFRTATAYAVTPGNVYTIAVGGGGAGKAYAGGASTNTAGDTGGQSVFDAITSVGGGGGSSWSAGNTAGTGAYGGGAGSKSATNKAGSVANQGGKGITDNASYDNGGGGGGSGANGADATSGGGGAGGAGTASSISGSSVTYAGGGGGGGWSVAGGAGGSGGGGAGGTANGTAGTANTGGGGGGGGGTTGDGAAGGSGIVIISYTPDSDTIGFTPDLVWIKDRTSALMHNIFDSVRSVYAYWSSNSSAAETGGFGQTLTAFLSNGFSLGTNSLFNTSGNNYISWLWKESTTSGVDVVTYTGDGASSQNISHSLGKAPAMAIVKRRDAAGDPYVWHTSYTGQTYFQKLDDYTVADSNTNTPFGGNGFTSTTFGVTNNSTNNLNASGGTYVAYLFATTTGFADFGKYTGNGSADGPFIYTGFKPKYVTVKWKSGSAGSGVWITWDSARDPDNQTDNRLFPNTTDVEVTTSAVGIDLLSNGFKIRSTNGQVNTSGDIFIYAAFADIPFKYSSAISDVGALSIASSTRFITGNTDNLSKTLSTPTDNKKWTYSVWLKRGALGAYETFLNAYTGVSNDGAIRFDSSDRIEAYDYTGSYAYQKVTTAVFRDPAAWIHVVFAVDTTQTGNNCQRLYVNGAEVTSWSTNTTSCSSGNTRINSAIAHTIGIFGGAAYNFDGYLSDAYFVDGQALTPSSFGEYDTSGYWRPKTYSGTYGTNGFHLPLMGTSTAASVGTDTSGNGNYWTVNNIATTDFVSDSPTNGFPTMNPINAPSSITFANGNLALSDASDTNVVTTGTTGINSGKWYYEAHVTTLSVGSKRPQIGWASTKKDGTLTSNTYLGDEYSWASDDNYWFNGAQTLNSIDFSQGDLLMFALDTGTGNMWFGKNGTWNEGDPAAGTGSPGGATTSPTLVPLYRQANNAGAVTITYNFGQSVSPTSTATVLPYRSSAGGYFQYAPPTDFKALSTANLPAPTVTIPKNYFDAVTYTGSGTATSTWSGFVAFQPDIVWLKDRTSANAHGIFASSTATYPAWASNASTAEGGGFGTALTGFLSNGFSLGASTTVNTSGDNYISWMWKESPTAGMDIVTYTGDNTSNRTISHSLGKSPDFAIVKRRDSATTGDPYVWHNKLTGAAYFLKLDTTAAQSNTTPPWGTGGWTSSTFMVSNGTENINVSGGTYVAYLFASTTGFSAFGTYTGNAAADGPFVYTGFKPRFVMIKSSTATDAWLIYDTARNTYNVAGTELVPNTAAADATISGIDFLSNGFKLRTITTTPNAAQTYVYAAFAEIPFYYSAQPAATAATTFVAAIAFLLGMTF